MWCVSEAFGHEVIASQSRRDGAGQSRETEAATVEALAALYHDGYHRFVRVAEAITGSVEDARDAVQEGFANALRQLDRYERRGSLDGWVWRSVVNAARMSRRRSRRVGPTGELGGLVEVALQQSERPDRLRPQLARLPERQRLVLFLRYFADLQYEAIADALEISPGTVAATLNAAHRSLRRWLEEVEE
jgi:RNA polymerase sigma-70 factor (ECF subfamily)